MCSPLQGKICCGGFLKQVWNRWTPTCATTFSEPPAKMLPDSFHLPFPKDSCTSFRAVIARCLQEGAALSQVQLSFRKSVLLRTKDNLDKRREIHAGCSKQSAWKNGDKLAMNRLFISYCGKKMSSKNSFASIRESWLDDECLDAKAKFERVRIIIKKYIKAKK